MPTINQLVRNPRSLKTKKESPHLGIGYNTIKKRYTYYNSTKKRSMYKSYYNDTKKTKLCDP